MFTGLGPVEDWTVEVSTDDSLSYLNEEVDRVEARLILIKTERNDCAVHSHSSQCAPFGFASK